MSKIKGPARLDSKTRERVRVLVDFLDGYFNIAYHGTENIPAGSRFVWTHNHCGWPSLDALVIGKKILDINHQATGEYESGLSFWHDLVARSPVVGGVVERLSGLSIKEVASYPYWQEHKIFATPAEGEEGSFRSSFGQRSTLTEFKSGIGRIACLGKAQYILPVSIIGPEESFPAMGRARIPVKKLLAYMEGHARFERLHGLVSRVSQKDLFLPFLLPLQGLPFSWYVRFHPPVDISSLVSRSDPSKFDKKTYKKIGQKAKEVIGKDLEREYESRRRFQYKKPKMTPAFKKICRQKIVSAKEHLENLLARKAHPPSDKENMARGHEEKKRSA